MQKPAPTFGVRVLTPRQREVLALIARGYTNGQIATELGITLDGAKFHVSEILERLDAPSRQVAGDMWRVEHSTPRRIRQGFRVLLGAGAWGAASAGIALAAAAGALWFVSAHSNAPVAEPTQQQIVAAVSRAGEVFHAEEMLTATGPGAAAPESREQWYSADDSAVRTQADGGGMLLGREDPDGAWTGPLAQYYQQVPVLPPAADASGPVTSLAYISRFASNDRLQFRGEEQHDGQPVLRWDGTHRVAEAERDEMYNAATVQYTILLRASDLLPVAVDSTFYSVDGGVLTRTTLDYRSVALVDGASLAAGFFDAPTPPPPRGSR